MYDHLVSDPSCSLRCFCNECDKKTVVDETSELGIWNCKMDVMFDKMDQILSRINSVENQMIQKADLQTMNTSGSAMAKGPCDALVSRNSATTKHPI